MYLYYIPMQAIITSKADPSTYISLILLSIAIGNSNINDVSQLNMPLEVKSFQLN